MITAEAAENLAQSFMRIADDIAEANIKLNILIREGGAVREEKEAIDSFGINAPETIHALRVLAMRMDRNALGKYEDSLA